MEQMGYGKVALNRWDYQAGVIAAAYQVLKKPNRGCCAT
jgi:hypothetical protein